MGRVSTKAFVLSQRHFICLENKLEKKASRSSNSNSSWWKAAQLFRCLQCSVFDKPTPAACPWAHEMIELEIRRCEIVQRETFLTEQCRQAEKNPQQKLDEWHIELKTLDQDYWSIERLIYANDIRCPNRPLRRAYVSCKKKPQWYLLDWLCEDCANRGGCCGRACGCCQKPRSVFRLNGHGHCTKSCGCCRQARGFELNEEQQKQCQLTFDLKHGPLPGHSRRMMEAYIYGFIFPFD